MTKRCARCTNRPKCTKLCDEVEKSLGPDAPEKRDPDGITVHVPTSRLPAEFIDFSLAGMATEPSRKLRKIVIALRFEDKRRQVDIVQLTGLSKQRVSDIVCAERKRRTK